MTFDQAGAQLLSETHFICFSKTKKPKILNSTDSWLNVLLENRVGAATPCLAALHFLKDHLRFLMRRALAAAVALRPNDRH